MKPFAGMLGAIGMLVAGSATPSLAFQCAIPFVDPGRSAEWAMTEASAIFEIVVYTAWHDAAAPGTVFYARGTVGRVFKGMPKREVTLVTSTGECEGCPSETWQFANSLFERTPFLVVAGEPRTVGDVVIYAHNACLEEPLPGPLGSLEALAASLRSRNLGPDKTFLPSPGSATLPR